MFFASPKTPQQILLYYFLLLYWEKFSRIFAVSRLFSRNLRKFLPRKILFASIRENKFSRKMGHDQIRENLSPRKFVPIKYFIKILHKRIIFTFTGEEALQNIYRSRNNLVYKEWYTYFFYKKPACKKTLNPLSANHVHIRNDTVVTWDSCNSGCSENYDIFVYKLEIFYKMVYKTFG